MSRKFHLRGEGEFFPGMQAPGGALLTIFLIEAAPFPIKGASPGSNLLGSLYVPDTGRLVQQNYSLMTALSTVPLHENHKLLRSR